MGFAGIFSNLWTLRKTGADTTICGALSKHRHNHWAEISGQISQARRPLQPARPLHYQQFVIVMRQYKARFLLMLSHSRIECCEGIDST